MADSRGRLSPAEMFPTGDDRFVVHDVHIPSGLRLRVVECGDTGAKDVVVCIHGWACSVYTFRQVMLALADIGRRVIAIDLVGHGLSDKPDAATYYTLDAITTHVAETLDALNVSSAIFIGHSMGGAVAARLAVQWPHRVCKLILCAPVGFGSAIPLKLIILLTPRLFVPLLPYCIPRWTVPLVFWAAYGTLRIPTSRDYDEYWAPTQFPSFVRAMRTLLHVFDWQGGPRSEFHHITAPTAVMYGSKDHFVVHSSAARYADTIPGARLVCIQGCGHVVPEEASDEVVATVLDLVSK